MNGKNKAKECPDSDSTMLKNNLLAKNNNVISNNGCQILFFLWFCAFPELLVYMPRFPSIWWHTWIRWHVFLSSGKGCDDPETQFDGIVSAHIYLSCGNSTPGRGGLVKYTFTTQTRESIAAVTNLEIGLMNLFNCLLSVRNVSEIESQISVSPTNPALDLTT